MLDPVRIHGKGRRAGLVSIAAALALSFVSASPAAADYRGGCTIPGVKDVPIIGPAIQELANAALLNVCNFHDNCYRACAPDDPGSLAAHKDSCDNEFWARWHGECILLAGVYVATNPDESRTVFELCEAAGVGAYAGVRALGGGPFYSGQCTICSSCFACNQMNMPIPTHCLPPPDPCNGAPPCLCYESGGTWVNDEGGGGHCAYSPILINLQSNGASDHLTSAQKGVRFDIAANGVSLRVAWPRKGTDVAFLALDRNGNGAVDDGSELFGTATRMRDGTVAANGFDALAEFDDDGDGRVDRRDSMFTSLRLWVDRNHNGRSEPLELLTPEQAGIVALNTGYSEARRRDQHGNWYRYRGTALISDDYDDDAHRRRIFDVYLVTAPE
jgi:hypothetical protein